MATAAIVDVRDIVQWLRQTEDHIGTLYAKAAEVCTEEPSFTAFLQGLSRDEESHAAFMSLALEQLEVAPSHHPLDIILDTQTRSMVEDTLDGFERLLGKTKVVKKDVVEYIARAEASELNPIFLYVAGEYREADREGERMASEIQGHLHRIQEYIDRLPRNLRPSVDVATLPLLGEDRFLVVEDHAPLRRLLASLLGRRGAVDTASEGREALERLQEHFHRCVVTDIQLEGMDGIEFYRRAVQYDLHLKGRFLFCSGGTSGKNEAYLKQNHLPLLRKPFGIEEFQKAVDTILTRT